VVEASFFMFPGDRMIDMVGHANARGASPS
jgi:hypothetical protein